MNDILTQINATLLGYASHFANQDKMMTHIKSSFDNLSHEMKTLKSQDLDLLSDMPGSDPVELEILCANSLQNEIMNFKPLLNL